jgi:hypothetical protein
MCEIGASSWFYYKEEIQFPNNTFLSENTTMYKVQKWTDVRISVTFTTNTITVSYLWLTTKINSNQILMSTT